MGTGWAAVVVDKLNRTVLLVLLVYCLLFYVSVFHVVRLDVACAVRATST